MKNLAQLKELNENAPEAIVEMYPGKLGWTLNADLNSLSS